MAATFPVETVLSAVPAHDAQRPTGSGPLVVTGWPRRTDHLALGNDLCNTSSAIRLVAQRLVIREARPQLRSYCVPTASPAAAVSGAGPEKDPRLQSPGLISMHRTDPGDSQDRPCRYHHGPSVPTGGGRAYPRGQPASAKATSTKFPPSAAAAQTGLDQDQDHNAACDLPASQHAPPSPSAADDG